MTYATDGDRNAQRRVLAELGRAMSCEWREFDDLTPIDAFAIRDRQMVALGEVKCRTHAYATHPTVYMSVRKWLALMLGHVCHNVPALFIVEWRDALGWIPLDEVDARDPVILGRDDRGAKFDREPIIEVPVGEFRLVRKS